MQEFQVNKSKLTQSRLVQLTDNEHESVAEGELLLKVDKFGFSANNITYGAIGEQLGYWQFFPPAGDQQGAWGMLPVWGFADVVASGVEDVKEGERLFGYFPPKPYLRMQNVNANAHRIIDGASHRASLPPGYNTYRRVNSEPGYDSSMDNLRMLLWPLHITSFCIWDSLQDSDWFGASQILIISASSKTSLGLGYALADDKNAPKTIGLTSGRNKSWVESLGIYEYTCSYDDLSSLDASLPTVIVDMSGNSELLGKLQSHFSDNMKYCIRVGLTHWDEASEDIGVDPNRSEFFFAPGHIQKRLKDWGPVEFEKKSADFMIQSSLKSANWLKMEFIEGVEGLASIYKQVCEGSIPPEQGLVIQL